MLSSDGVRRQPTDANSRVRKRSRLMGTKFLALVAASAMLAAWLTDGGRKSESRQGFKIAVVGNPDVLQSQYENWERRVAAGGGQSYVLGLSWIRGLSKQETEAQGSVTFDFTEELISAEVKGLPDDTPMDLWVVDNHDVSGSRVDPESGDPMLRLGSFEVSDGVATLHEGFPRDLVESFVIDLAVVVPRGLDPIDGGFLYGIPSLFQRLHAKEQALVAKAEKGAERVMTASISFAFQSGGEATGFPEVFFDLVTQGEDIFFNETFDGNGRTCGTCHAATNNFTIDTKSIAKLKNDDPLFVAEFVPALIFGDPANLDPVTGLPRRFENPELMRAFGVIVENQDGMGDLENRFNMRGVPHNIGMTVSIATPPGGLTPPDERTGWSGDGAPSGMVGSLVTSGRLRDFTVGAVVQHFPKTLDRDFSGVDMRLPTIAELDAVEAFLLSLGRQIELEIRDGFPDELILKDDDAEEGKVLFRDGVPGGSGSCGACHLNAGANAPFGGGGNRNFNTGVEAFLRNRITDSDFTVLGEPRPVDGGFGTNPDGDFTSLVPQPGFVNENFGDGSFNTPSVVEAADTPPFFHNNVADNLEEAIEFYNTPEFIATTFSGVGIDFDEDQVDKVASFMRVINAIDNIENFSIRSANKAILALDLSDDDDVINRILALAIADAQDAEKVLKEGKLHKKERRDIKKAMREFKEAMSNKKSDSYRIEKINEGIEKLDMVLTELRE